MKEHDVWTIELGLFGIWYVFKNRQQVGHGFSSAEEAEKFMWSIRDEKNS